MKKFFASIFLILGILLAIELGISYYVAGIVEQKFKDSIDLLNGNDVFSIDLVYFRKGALRSTAVTHIRYKPFENAKPIEVKHVFYNGPLIFTPSSDKLFQFKMAIVNSTPGELPKSVSLPFTSQAIIDYRGGIELTAAGNAFSVTHNQYMIKGTGWSFRSLLDNQWQNLNSEVEFPGITVDLMGTNLNFQKIKATFDQTITSEGDWPGKISIAIDNISDKAFLFELSNVQFMVNETIKSELLDFGWNLGFESLKLANTPYGPLSLDLQLNHLAMVVLKKLSQKSSGEPISDEMMSQLLQHSPEIIVNNASLSLPGGQIDLSMNFKVGGSDIKLPISKEMIENTLEGDFSLSIPKDMLKEWLSANIIKELGQDVNYQKLDPDHKKQYLEQQLALKLQKFSQDGIVTEKDKNYLIKMSISKGKWTVDGKEVTPPIS